MFESTNMRIQQNMNAELIVDTKGALGRARRRQKCPQGHTRPPRSPTRRSWEFISPLGERVRRCLQSARAKAELFAFFTPAGRGPANGLTAEFVGKECAFMFFVAARAEQEKCIH